MSGAIGLAMPFLFSHVCDLLSALESHHTIPKKDDLSILYRSQIASWIAYFRSDLTPDLWLPLFSLLWPEGRSDRVYGFKEDGLINAISTAMCLGTSRVEELRNWRVGRGDQDLGECVERVFAMAENIIDPSHAVTITEIEDVLNQLAAHCRFSSGEIRSRRNETSALDKTKGLRQTVLGSIYRRLSSRDAKWFTRILLKSLLPLTLGPDNLFSQFHFLLPEIWGVRNDLKSALGLLGSKTFKLFPCIPKPEDEKELREAGCMLLLPEIGVKVGRPPFAKGLSCEAVLKMARNETWAMERKYDGEYCQIHIDLAKGKDWLKIFSKSGKDSTQDRIGCHSIIRECLHLNTPEKRKIKQKCILEAEFLIFSQETDQIASFHTIRNHVMRAGTYIGTRDGGRKSTEHIMLKFFDCILLDDICTPSSSYNSRRHHLEALVSRISNKAELVTRKVIDFSKENARELFFETFAEGIGMKWEGFVMKPCSGSYVGWGIQRGNYWIKLKKDYIEGFGDSGDFVIVGGRGGGKRGIERGLDPSTANTFYAACLTNKQDVIVKSAKPIFKIVFTVSYNLSQADIAHLKHKKYFDGIEFSDSPSKKYDLLPLDEHFQEPNFLFSMPPVVECFGGGFDKIDVTDYWTLRWPRVKKIHKDRDYLEALTFDELQDMGNKSVTISADYAQEVKEWEAKLKANKPRRRSNPGGPTKVKTTGLLTKCFWEADSPTTKRLHESISPRQEESISASQLTQETEEPESPAERRLKRALSQISGNSQSQPVDFDSQNDFARIIRSSPLFETQVYVMECLMKTSEVEELLSGLDIKQEGSCKDLTLETSVLQEDTKRVLLVEERNRAGIRCLLKMLHSALVTRKIVVEVYSWRILKQMKALADEKTAGKRRKTAEDWSLMHLDTIQLGAG